jgi:hypothetical protein
MGGAFRRTAHFYLPNFVGVRYCFAISNTNCFCIVIIIIFSAFSKQDIKNSISFSSSITMVFKEMHFFEHHLILVLLFSLL